MQIPDKLHELAQKFSLPDVELREMASLFAAMDEREREALNLYEPLEWQDGFHKSTAKERICIAANQEGKSLTAYVELVRAVTGQDPHGKYPKKDGVAMIVGYDEKFTALNPYRYLFKKGAFKIIRNEQGKWEAWKPWVPWHKEHENEAVPAPPLLPRRFLRGGSMEKAVSWLKKKDRVFHRIELTTGWVIYAFGSRGAPAPGFQADLAVIDEDIEKGEWYAEIVARLKIRRGKLIWAALPLMANDELSNLIDRAEELQGTDNPMTVRFSPSGPNPYIDSETREQNAIAWKASGDDVYRARALGDTDQLHRKMYPTFDPRFVHNGRRETEPRSLVQKILRERGGVPPADWTRYMIVDPGHTVCAVLFVAAPPPTLGDFRVAYQECYVRQCDAFKFGQAVQPHAVNWAFEAFIVDSHGAALRDLGSGLLPREMYSDQLKARGISSVKTGHGFIDGCDKIQARIAALREWLAVRPDGTPKLYVIPETCPNLCREMKNFKKKIDPQTKVPDEDGHRRTNSHAVETLEYAAAHGCDYVKTENTHVVTERDRVVEAIRKRQRLEANATSGYGVVLGATG